MLDITHQLPIKIKNHGGQLYEINLGDKIKYVLENKTLKYRTFTYISLNEESTATLKEDLFNAYYCDLSVRTNTDRY